MHRLATRVCALVIALGVAARADATWSIVTADRTTGEVGVGTVSCLTDQDLMSVVPVVVVGKGSAAVQAFADYDGIRRPVIFDHLELGTPPAEILDLLEKIEGHDFRQYGIVDANGRRISFSGSRINGWFGGVTGSIGDIDYAIQGNALAGSCVVFAMEAALFTTEGDMAAKLMAAMVAGYETGGDGRCSCSIELPEKCGCPPAGFDKAGHIGGMVVSRLGDADDDVCDFAGCADGDYYMDLNVAFQNAGDPDPVVQLVDAYTDWRGALDGRPDAHISTITIEPFAIPPNGVSVATLVLKMRDWEDDPVNAPMQSLTIEHAPDSAGLTGFGVPNFMGFGTYHIVLTAGENAGTDRFIVVADDGIRPVQFPEVSYRYYALGDVDADGVVGFLDVLGVLGSWGPCPPWPEACLADLDGDECVGFADLLILLGRWS